MAEYTSVTPTPEERAQWVRRNGARRGFPQRVQCNRDGVRFWLSGIGLGSHRRSAAHRAALAAVE